MPSNCARALALAALLSGCAESTEGPVDAVREAGAGASTSSGGGGAGASSGGVASAGGSASGGATREDASDPAPGTGAASSAGGGAAVPTDAAGGATVEDAAAEAAPSCGGMHEVCDENATCCEAYACRAGQCCVPNGVWSRCLANTDCCSNHCVLEQCTCVPLGYSCTGPGQCCSGFECRAGTCICPPDIRGCN